MRWYEEGQEPDYRFTLANERTYLAWIRTALAVLAAAILLRQFASGMQPHGLLLAVAGTLAAVAGLIGGASYLRWRGNEHALRLGRPLPRTLLLGLLSVVLVMLSAAALLLVLWR